MFVNFGNPKMIYKCFNGVHMWLRNYISEELVRRLTSQSYCAKNHCRNSARDPLGYISGSKAKVCGMVMSSFLQSAFCPGPRGNSNTKNIASPLPVKTTDQGFCHNIAEKHGYVSYLP